MLDKTDPDELTGGAEAADRRPSSALREALRRARAEAAERTDVVIDMRAAEIARLEILRDALEPVFAQVPQEIDLFDVGLVPGDRPRLFVDMVSFVEMGRDRRAYRFMRDGRHGRSVVVESDRVEPVVEAVTSYVARRLIERERLLVDDELLSAPAVAAPARAQPAPVAATTPEPAAAPVETQPAPAVPVEPAPPPAEKPKRRGWLRALSILLAFAVGGAIGALVVIALILAAARGYLPI